MLLEFAIDFEVRGRASQSPADQVIENDDSLLSFCADTLWLCVLRLAQYASLRAQ